MDQQSLRPTLSAFWPYTPSAIDDVARWSEVVSGGPFERLWLGQSVALDTAAAVSYSAGTGRRCPVGIAVNVIPMHHPLALTQSLRAIAEATRHDVTACFSAGDPVAQQRFTGRRYASPLTAAREFLTVLRGLIDGEHVRHDGKYFPLDARMPARPSPHRVHLGLGVLRPGMARLTGELADLATTWLTPPDYLRDVIVPALQQGADSAGRARPRLVSPVHAIVAAPGRDAARLAEAAIGKHLRTPSYRTMLEQSGQGEVLERGHTAALDSGLVTYGSPDDIARRVAEVATAGADEVPIVLHQPRDLPWAALREEWYALGDVIERRLQPRPAPIGSRPA